jgi:uncharacterized paraquat-inducible protein A
MNRTKTWLAYLLVGAIVSLGTGPVLAAISGDTRDAQIVYTCKTCDFHQADRGKCPDCDSELSKASLYYECAKCGMWQVKSGNCGMCGTKLRIKKVPVKG